MVKKLALEGMPCSPLPFLGDKQTCADRLFDGLTEEFQVWMSHGDKLSKLPEGFFDIGATDSAEHAAIASLEHLMYVPLRPLTL